VNIAIAPRSRLRRPKILLACAKSGSTATEEIRMAFGTQM
jgi:hypothetical protein